MSDCVIESSIQVPQSQQQLVQSDDDLNERSDIEEWRTDGESFEEEQDVASNRSDLDGESSCRSHQVQIGEITDVEKENPVADINIYKSASKIRFMPPYVND